MAEYFFSFDEARQVFDLANTLATDDEAELYNAVVISLFTDARAKVDDRLPDEPRIGAIPASLARDRRGWHGDRQIGSRRWLLCREKQVPEVLQRLEDYDREALQWLITDKVCSSIDIAESFPSRGLVLTEITLYRPGVPALTYKFQMLWDSLGGFNAV
ncbi:phage GP46 family protein [Ferrovibrio terrae]|uniref:phage GP46 family protein n=1 Tax=Ferrovibrio terrae TaxID=2594003 RepID=UPI003137767B